MARAALKFPPRPITGDMAQMVEDMKLADPAFETPREIWQSLLFFMGGSITLDYYQIERPSVTDFGHQPRTFNRQMPDCEPNPFKRHRGGPYIPVEPNPYAGLGMGQGEPRRPLFTIKITDK